MAQLSTTTEKGEMSNTATQPIARATKAAVRPSAALSAPEGSPAPVFLPEAPVDPFLAAERELGRLHRTLMIPVDGVDWQKTRLSMNDRLHPHSRAKRTKWWREAAAQAARSVRGVERARVLIYYRFATNHRREVNNLMPTSKAIVDGLVDAGVFPDDNDKHVIGPDNRREPVNGPHSVIVRVYVAAD